MEPPKSKRAPKKSKKADSDTGDSDVTSTTEVCILQIMQENLLTCGTVVIYAFAVLAIASKMFGTEKLFSLFAEDYLFNAILPIF